VITLAASIKKPVAVFVGMILGYVVVVGLAVAVGQALLAVIPLSTLTFVSGIIFIVLGLLMLRVDVENGVRRPRAKSPLLAALIMIILTELGDKTQIATIALAARFAQPIAVFFGAMSAFAIVDGLSIVLADRLTKQVSTGRIKKVAAIIFIILGILTLLRIY
jgi:putative Ca2+/H+ antiporter (TMEM165/GDT1 family)